MRALRRLAAGLAGVVLLASPAGSQDPDNSPEALRAEAYEAAQWAMASDAAEALARVSARYAEGQGELGELAERRERLLAGRDAQERELATLYGAEGDAARARRAELTDAYEASLDGLKAVEAEIDVRFPAYAELVAPRALSVAETQALLNPDEALLLVLVNPEATYVWGISRERVVWARAADLGEAEMTRSVGRLRSTLTTAGARRDEGDPTVDPMIWAGRGGLTFDRAEAHRLYKALIEPVESAFAGKTTLMSVVSGPLTGLPLAVLSPAPPGSADDAGWLIDRYALATLPAASSLKSLRCHLVVGPARHPGCPPALTARAEMREAGARLPLVAYGAPTLGGAAVSGPRGAPTDADAVRGEGALADPAKLRALPSLPGSRAELEALSASYPSGIVRIGADATETAVKATDADALSRARFVVFSTHGLMAGSAFAEPGLVLTPPDAASAVDDGYLTASEAAGLRLNADLVVLSACNTAAPDGRPGAEGLSGLARAFFYAGGRAVLVSHWAVSDQATRTLTGRTFSGLDAYGADPAARARALRDASLAVRAETRWRHPAYWAAFTLVGAP
ncbi:MAG TPA: CHAT domain-containing protein [Brevundimonas sp.]|jgi:CHAT domain-containing protein|uniref:CHAT domain-containing protein n=1 Tax=Brevundimonas sp. TaxID=1871086 RepID=UPI002DE49FE2|nr:CHAT domain-containing protein [Brevundimonas sp.]